MEERRGTFGVLLVVALVLLCAAASSGKSTLVLTKTPLNSAVVVGNSLEFECASDSTFIAWYFQSNQDQVVYTIYDGQVLNPVFEGVYSILPKTGGQYDLIVLNATLTETGIYRCKESTGFDPHQTAALVVLDSDPVCSINVSLPSVMMGDVISMTCRVTYTPNLSSALMRWTDPQGFSVTSTESISEGYLESNITVVAAVPSVEQYRCRTYFDVPPAESLLTAKNAPEYEYFFNSPILAVNHCPSSVQITVPPGELRVGDVITCSSNGYPSPDYTWTHVQTGQQSSGSALAITRAGLNTYICTATVSIPDQPTCSLSTSTNVTVVASSCLEIKLANNLAASARYTLTLRNGKSFEAYCEMGLNGGGYTFLSPQSLLDLTDDDIQPMFTDRIAFLMRLRKYDDLQTYTVVRQLARYSHIPLKLGLSNTDGYIATQNEITTRLGFPFLYFGFLSDNMTRNSSFTTWGFNVNNIDVPATIVAGGRNYIALFPGFLEAGFYNTGSTTLTACTSMLTTYQINVASTRPMPEEYFMSLEVFFTSLCQTASNSANMASQLVRNAAIGFR